MPTHTLKKQRVLFQASGHWYETQRTVHGVEEYGASAIGTVQIHNRWLVVERLSGQTKWTAKQS